MHFLTGTLYLETCLHVRKSLCSLWNCFRPVVPLSRSFVLELPLSLFAELVNSIRPIPDSFNKRRLWSSGGTLSVHQFPKKSNSPIFICSRRHLLCFPFNRCKTREIGFTAGILTAYSLWIILPQHQFCYQRDQNANINTLLSLSISLYLTLSHSISLSLSLTTSSLAIRSIVSYSQFSITLLSFLTIYRAI